MRTLATLAFVLSATAAAHAQEPAWSLASDFDAMQQPPDAEGYAPGFKPWAVETRWDDGLFIEDETGYGAEAVIGTKGAVMAGFKLGYAGWNTETVDDEPRVPPGESVRVRQYRGGIGANIALGEILEMGAWLNGGVYRFRRDHENDTSPFFEFEGLFVVKLGPVRLGVIGLATHTKSSFNHSHTHAYHNYSGGPIVEVRF